MEQIVGKLLVPNNKTIQEGTKELKEAFKKPEAIPALCDLIVVSANPQIRQTASILLRRKLGKRRQWSKLPIDLRARIKQGMLQALVNEKEKFVKNGIAQFVGVIGKHEFVNNSWPELLEFIRALCSSEATIDREMGMYTLSIVTNMSSSSYITHAESFAVLFTNILQSLTAPNSNLAYYTVMTMKNLVPLISGHQHMINIYNQHIPRILEIINSFTNEDGKRVCDLMEILEELIEYAVTVIVPHIKLIIEMCLHMGSNAETPMDVQIKAISVVGWIIRTKSKVIQKNHLVEPIIDVLLKLMAQPPEDDGREEYFLGDIDQFTSITVATQTLDLIALHIPADKVVPYILKKVEPAIQCGNIYEQKAAYLSLAILAEGCAERIRSKYLNEILKCVCNAIHNPNAVVRNAALFALGQFAEHLQPDISKFASDLLPILFEYLRQVLEQVEVERKDPPSLDRLFYALETFCENLEDELTPYLPTLMERLFVALRPDCFSMQLKKDALGALGAAATAVKEGIMPYFQKIIEILNFYITPNENPDINEIKPYAIETLAVVAQFVGPDNFRPLAAESLKLGLQIIDNSDDPDVKKSVYALFAALAIVMKEELGPALPKIVAKMIESLQSSEGIVSHHDEEDNEEVDVYAELSDSDENAEEDIDGSSSASDDSVNCRFSVENAYNEEKEQACLALREICSNTGHAFLPFIEQSIQEVLKLLNYPQDDIRKVSVEALQQFCLSLHKVKTSESEQVLYKALQRFIPKCAELIRMDEERSVVIVSLDAFAALLDEIKGGVFAIEGHQEAVMNCIVDVLNMKTYCQNTDSETNENNEGLAEAEQDELLLESAGDVIPKFGAALPPGEFLHYFSNVMKLLSGRTMNQNSLSQRSFAYGTLAECMKVIGVYVQRFVPDLLKLWLRGAKDSAEEVRNNSIFGLGEMILHGGETVFGYYNEILQALSEAVGKERHAGTLDNICGALAKMIIANPTALPLDQVFPAFLQKLPLREDFQENEAVIKCFATLYQQGNAVLKQHLGDVMKATVHVYCKDQLPNDETKQFLVEFIRTLNRDFAQDFAHAVNSLGPEATDSIQKLLMT